MITKWIRRPIHVECNPVGVQTFLVASLDRTTVVAVRIGRSDVVLMVFQDSRQSLPSLRRRRCNTDAVGAEWDELHPILPTLERSPQFALVFGGLGHR
jgi:hypothetical protein